MSKSQSPEFQTLAIHCDRNVSLTPDLAPALHLSTTFLPNEQGFIYSRIDQPTRQRAETVLGNLEGGSCVLYSSGSAATSAIIHHIVPKSIFLLGVGYHGTKHVVTQFKNLTRCQVIEIDDPNTIDWNKVQKGDLLLMESPRNPDCHLLDLESIAKHAANAGVITAVDSTFATPFLQRPLFLGISFVYHSCTKFLGGHSDILGGAVICKNDEDAKTLKSNRTIQGNTMGSLECYLLLRSFRTLPVRMKAHCKNARKVAEFLNSCSLVKVVHNPCLPGHQGHEIWKRTMKYAPPCFSFEVETQVQAKLLMDNLKLFANCTSLGGVESTVDWRHRWDSGQPPGLLRVSIGLEAYEDLIEDLKRGLSLLQVTEQ